MEPKLMTYEQLCTRYGFRKGTIYSLVHENRIPHVRLGRRFVRFEAAAIEEWIKARSVQPVSESPDESGPGKAGNIP
jgi:excisionase family DNA binding protein